jgi:hypothetical protein
MLPEVKCKSGLKSSNRTFYEKVQGWEELNAPEGI